jgi:hypothetical protein
MGPCASPYCMNYTASTTASLQSTADSVWAIITDAVAKNYMIGCATDGHTLFGLVTSHSWSVLDTEVIPGSPPTRLIRIRNPWGVDSTYTGAWNDNDSIDWTDVNKGLIPYSNNATDGMYYISVEDFVRGFIAFTVGYSLPNYQNNIYDNQNDDGKEKWY